MSLTQYNQYLQSIDLDHQTFMSIVDAYRTRNINALLSALSKRPMLFARQLARVIRAFPEQVELTAGSFAVAGRSLPAPVLVHLHNQFANAQRGVGVHLTLDHQRHVQALAAPLVTVEQASLVLWAIECCLSGRLRGQKFCFAVADYSRVMPVEDISAQCNPSFDGAVNLYSAPLWEDFPLGEGELLWASGVRKHFGGYGLALHFYDGQLRRVGGADRYSPTTEHSCFWDGAHRPGELREHAEVQLRAAVEAGIRYVLLSAEVELPIPGVTACEHHSVHSAAGDVPERMQPYFRALRGHATKGVELTHQGDKYRLVPGAARTACALLDLYTQRVCTLEAGLGVGPEHDAHLRGLVAQNVEYKPMTVRQYLDITGASVVQVPVGVKIIARSGERFDPASLYEL